MNCISCNENKATSFIYDIISKKGVKMVSYTQKEMIDIAEFSKSVNDFVDKIETYTVAKLAIIRHNKPAAVLVSADEYERIKNIQDYLEDLEIASIIKERSEPTEMMISQDDMLEFLKQRGCNV